LADRSVCRYSPGGDLALGTLLFLAAVYLRCLSLAVEPPSDCCRCSFD
jgi:hypothetical protein